MQKNIILLCCILVCFVGLTGCTDNTHLGHGCDFEACGGDPTGHWAIEGSCHEPEILPPDESCPSATGEHFYEMAGDIWFNNDGTVVKVIVGTNIMLMEYPSECIDDWGITCAELSQSIQDHWKEELGQDAIIECDPDAEGCDCMVVVAQLDITSSTWEVSSTDPYVINHGTPGNPTDRFCQSGDHMEIEFHGDPNIPDTTLTLVREDN